MFDLLLALVISGVVTDVHDGDTITVDYKHKIRLQYIDAPELKQEAGEDARDHLAYFAMGMPVNIDVAGKPDRYGRLLGVARLGKKGSKGGKNLNETMLKDGYAWQYYDKDSRRAALMTQARANYAGLWAEPKPIPPWQFRKPVT